MLRYFAVGVLVLAFSLVTANLLKSEASAGIGALSPATLPNGQVGQAYSQTFTSPFPGIAQFNGNLPPGLTLPSTVGTTTKLSGIPTQPGTFTFSVRYGFVVPTQVPLVPGGENWRGPTELILTLLLSFLIVYLLSLWARQYKTAPWRRTLATTAVVTLVVGIFFSVMPSQDSLAVPALPTYTVVITAAPPLSRNRTAARTGLGTQGQNFFGNVPNAFLPQSMSQVTPGLFFAQTDVVVQNAGIKFDHLGQQLQALRGSTSGPGSSLSYLFKQGFKEQDSWADNAKSPTATDVNLNKAKAVAAVDKKIKEDTSKWSVFADGYGVFSDFETVYDQPGYQSTSAGGLFGANYRFLKNLAAGVHTGFTLSEADLAQWDSKMNIQSFSIGGQATYFTQHGLYIDAMFDYSFNWYDTKRHIILPGFDAVAKSDTDGGQVSARLGGGWEKKIGNWSVGPDGALEFTHVDVDGFTEKGASFFNLHVKDDSADSLKFKVGGHVSHTTHFGWGTLVPDLRIHYTHEFLDDNRNISAIFQDVGVTAFTFKTDRAGRDSGLFGAGLTANVGKRISVYVNYDAELFKQDQTTQSVFGGFRIRF